MWHRSMAFHHQCFQTARWLVGFSLLTFISVLQSSAPTAVLWPWDWFCRPVSLVFSWGLHGLGLMMPPNEMQLPRSIWIFGKYGTAFSYSYAFHGKRGGKNVWPTSDILSPRIRAFSKLAQTQLSYDTLCSQQNLPSWEHRCKIQQKTFSLWPSKSADCHGISSSSSTTSVWESSSKREKQSSH